MRCVIRVIERRLDEKLCAQYLKKSDAMQLCDKVKEGDKFVVKDAWNVPDGFCDAAWADIRPYILSMCTGASFPVMKDPTRIPVCCTDLFRPVIFEIQRLDD
ncbi:MAG: TIGR04076 family protein [Spirochaetes bacterium]|jgi:uncharacterized repeat protein (TIGR04076 family)|nr:TIGR04076 family protein [Spirochaetota bacterium]